MELLVCTLVGTLILTTAFISLSTTFAHMRWLVAENRETLREFHLLNYVRFDYVRHATKRAFVQSSVLSSFAAFEFIESIDGVLKKVRYEMRVTPDGQQIVERKTLTLNNVHLNTRRFIVSKPVGLRVSRRNGLITIYGARYGNVVLPIEPPEVQVRSLSVRKVRKFN